MTHPAHTAQPPARQALGLLLSVVLTATLFCALALAAPVTAQAATYGDGTIISSDATLTGQSFAGTITINAGVTLTLASGCTAEDGTIFTGGGTLKIGNGSQTITALSITGFNAKATIHGLASVEITGGTGNNGTGANISNFTIKNCASVVAQGSGEASAINSMATQIENCGTVRVSKQASGGPAILSGYTYFTDCPDVRLSSDGGTALDGRSVTFTRSQATTTALSGAGYGVIADTSITINGGSLTAEAYSNATGAALGFNYSSSSTATKLVVPVEFGLEGGSLTMQGAQAIKATKGSNTSQVLQASSPQNTQPWQLFGPAANDFTINPVAKPLELDFALTFGMPLILKLGSDAPDATAADPSLDATGLAPDFETAAYYARHYDYWLGALTQLNALGQSGTITMDTHGHGIDHIEHFVFDALVGTSRTLVVHHRGEVYTIRGRAESAGGKMGGIALGHNHSFDILGAYKTGSASNTASSTQRG